jgi:hypothetical protein
MTSYEKLKRLKLEWLQFCRDTDFEEMSPHEVLEELQFSGSKVWLQNYVVNFINRQMRLKYNLL